MHSFPHLPGSTDFPDINTVDPFGKYPTGFDYNRWNSKTKITVCKVPWDTTRNVVDWESEEARDSWFSGLTDTVQITLESEMRVLPDGIIKLPIPFSTMTQYNYIWVEFTEAVAVNDPLDYETVGSPVRKWGYFVDNLKQIATSTTECRLTMDYWTTFETRVSVNYVQLDRGHAPMAEANIDDYLSNPITNSGLLNTPDVTYGDPAAVVRDHTFYPWVGDKPVVMFASLMSPGQIDALEYAEEWSGGPTDPVYSDTTDRWGHQYEVTGYDWNLGNMNYSNLETNVEPFGVTGGLPTGVFVYMVEADKAAELFGNIVKYAPQVMSTLQSVWFVPGDLTSQGKEHTLAKVTIYEASTINDMPDISVELNKDMFGYSDKYKNVTKLYTYPYAALELSDNDGKSVVIKIENTGELKLHRRICLAYPYLKAQAFLTGANGSGAKTYKWTELSGEEREGISYDTTWQQFLVDFNVPTYMLSMDGSVDWAIHNQLANLDKQREVALNSYHKSMRGNNTSYENTLDSNETSLANANRSADTGYSNTIRSADTAKENETDSINTAKDNTLRSNKTARDNASRSNTMAKTNSDASANTAKANADASATTAKSNADASVSTTKTNADASANTAKANADASAKAAYDASVAANNVALTVANRSALTENTNTINANATARTNVEESMKVSTLNSQNLRETNDRRRDVAKSISNRLNQEDRLISNYNVDYANWTNLNGIKLANEMQKEIMGIETTVGAVSAAAQALGGLASGQVGTALQGFGGLISIQVENTVKNATMNYNTEGGLQQASYQDGVNESVIKHTTNKVEISNDEITSNTTLTNELEENTNNNNVEVTNANAEREKTTGNANANRAYSTATQNAADTNAVANANALLMYNTALANNARTNETSLDNNKRTYDTGLSNNKRTYDTSLANNKRSNDTALANNSRVFTTAEANADAVKTTGDANANDSAAMGLRNTNRTRVTAGENAVASRDTAKKNALDTTNTSNNNAYETRESQEFSAKTDLEQAQSVAGYLFRQQATANPVRFGQNSGDPIPDAFGYRGVQVRVVTQPDGSIRQAGDQMLRYGYSFKGAWDVISWSCMKHFTYWKCEEVWLDAERNVLESAKNNIKLLLTNGVTIWRTPDIIGKVGLYDNWN